MVISSGTPNGKQRIARGCAARLPNALSRGRGIDFDTLEREIDWLFDCGSDGIVMAMVSEVLRLSGEERKALAEAACRFGLPRGSVTLSVGAESSFVAEGFARHAESVGATAVMAIPPVSIAIDEGELRRYYERILNVVAIPVIVQDASGYVGRPMSIALQAMLFNEYGPRILFKPERADWPAPQRVREHERRGASRS
ncbi:MAG: dihydrodipicolinate synthase family protein, partial [Anaerolineae bacterium]|nr:dihydrodipicolinate synthase family protein [Anaerolineae bacterium]